MSDLAEDVLAPGLEEEFGLYEADQELKEEAKQQLEKMNGEQQYETPEKEKLLGGDQDQEKAVKQRKLPFQPKVTENELNNPEIGLYKLAQKMKRIDRAPLRDDSRIIEDICKAYEEWQISFCPRFEQYWFLQKVSELGKKQSVQLHMEEIRRDYKGATPLSQIIQTDTFANYRFGRIHKPANQASKPDTQSTTPVKPVEEIKREQKREEPVIKKHTVDLGVKFSDLKGSLADLYQEMPQYSGSKKKEEEVEKIEENDLPEGLFDDD